MSGYYVVRKDLVEEMLLIPAINTTSYYGPEEVLQMKYLGWVDEDLVDVADDDASRCGVHVKFRAPEGHIVFLYSIDLEWIETGVVESDLGTVSS